PPPTLPEVAVAGRSNVGKSSLLNALLGRRGLARTSSTPGRTRQLNFFLVNEQLVIVDLPGYGFAVGSEAERGRRRPPLGGGRGGVPGRALHAPGGRAAGRRAPRPGRRRGGDPRIPRPRGVTSGGGGDQARQARPRRRGRRARGPAARGRRRHPGGGLLGAHR